MSKTSPVVPSESPFSSILGAAIGGAVTGIILWYLINSLFGLDWIAIVRAAGWPVSTAWLALAIGAVLGAGKELLDRREEVERVAAVQDIAADLGFTYGEDTPRPTAACALPCLAGWDTGPFGTRGEVGGVVVSVFDMKKEVEDPEGGTNTVWQTVALVPTAGLPPFTVSPRRSGGWLADAFGEGGMTFDPAAAAPPDADTVRRFRKSFRLVFLRLAPADTEWPAPPLGDRIQTNEDKIRRLFTPALMLAFLERTGYAFQSDGEWLACYRGSDVLPPHQRAELMATVAVVRSALLAAADLPAEGLPPLPRPTAEQYTARAMGMLCGALLGAFGTFVGLAGFLFEVMGMRGSAALFLSFLGFVTGGIAGGFLGYWIGAAVGRLPAVKNPSSRPAESPQQKLQSARGTGAYAWVGLCAGLFGGFLLLVALSKYLFPQGGVGGVWIALFPVLMLGGAMLGGIAGALLGRRMARRRDRSAER